MYTIIIVDDNMGWNNMINSKLSDDENFTVYSAYDGAAGIDLIEKHKPDLIICDMVMPKQGGIAVIEHIRRMENYKPLIYTVTGAASEHLTTILYNLKVDLQSIRPFDPNEVKQNVYRLLEASNTLKFTTDGAIAVGYIRKQVENTLYSLGVPSYLVAYRITTDSLIELLESEQELNLSEIFYSIAEKHKIKPKAVESNIRFFIKKAISANSDTFNVIFNESKEKRISPLAFLTSLERYIRAQIDAETNKMR